MVCRYGGSSRQSPIGVGRTKVMAIACLFYRLLHSKWKIDGIVQSGTILINEETWRDIGNSKKTEFGPYSTGGNDNEGR